MPIILITLAAFCLAWIAPPASLACSPPLPTSPTIYERESEGCRYVLAMVESPDGYALYAPTPRDLALLEKYPAGGVYPKNGPFHEPLWTLADLVDEVLPDWAILSFFEEGGSVYLIETYHFPFRIWKDGEQVDGPDRAQSADWFHAPWTDQASCGGDLYEVDIVAGESGRAVRVRTGEGGEFHYSATTGKLLKEDRPRSSAAQPANGGENRIAHYVHALSQLAEARAAEAFDRDSSERFAELWAEACGMLNTKEEMQGNFISWVANSGWFPAGPGITALQKDIPFGSRLLHELDKQIDLYRIPPGKAMQALCLEPFNIPSGPMELLEERYGPRVAGRLPRFQERLNGPTVLAVTSWPKPKESRWEDSDHIGALGSATLWSDTDDGWRIVALVQFFLPPKNE